MQRSFKVAFDDVFGRGTFQLGDVVPVRDFDRSTKERTVQAVDDAGVPLWAVEVLDGDPEARQRTLKVKIAAPVQPVPPSALDGMPFRPVEFDGLTVTPYVDTNGQRPRLALSLRATAMRAPSRGHKSSPVAA
jgi:hypothetical protein